MSESIRVVVRIKPGSDNEDGAVFLSVSQDETVISIQNPQPLSSPGRLPQTCDVKAKNFDFSRIYDATCSQSQIFEDLASPTISDFQQGYNICIFAYGATGSGKTYTMMGVQENPGLCRRACERIFVGMDPMSHVQISFLEIYAERVRDLLPNHSRQVSSNLRVREHPIRGPYVEGLVFHKVTTFQEANRLLLLGLSRRMESSTTHHENSSRSHAIFTITLSQNSTGKCPSKISKLNLVDLAGCERIKSCLSKEQVKEGACINRSLSTLGNVICALSEYYKQSQSGNSFSPSKKPFIPYRNSTLTWLLKDSIGGNSKTVMIATVSSNPAVYKQNLSTLTYAQRAQNIINQPIINEDPNVKLIRDLQNEIKRLKSYISHNQIAEELNPMYVSITEDFNQW